MDYKQEAPFAVQIELTEGCNLRCSFCGLNGIREAKVNNFKFMTDATLRAIMEEIAHAGWNPRVEFAMHGEPSMHPDLVNMIKVAHEAAPHIQLMMTSNGGGLLRDTGPLITSLFSAGLTVLALDDYDGIKIVPKIRAAWDKYESSLVTVIEYPREKAKGSPHTRYGKRDKVLIFIQDISKAEDGNHSLLNNHAGAGAPKNDRGEGKACAKPFREMSFRWDGNVAICCNDWRGEYKCGNIGADPEADWNLETIWNNDAFDAARRKLIRGERDFGPCAGCDATSYRVGLLPDKKGARHPNNKKSKVEKIPSPNARTDQIINMALAGDPYTKPVLRPWETK